MIVYWPNQWYIGLLLSFVPDLRISETFVVGISHSFWPTLACVQWKLMCEACEAVDYTDSLLGVSFTNINIRSDHVDYVDNYMKNPCYDRDCHIGFSHEFVPIMFQKNEKKNCNKTIWLSYFLKVNMSLFNDQLKLLTPLFSLCYIWCTILNIYFCSLLHDVYYVICYILKWKRCRWYTWR